MSPSPLVLILGAGINGAALARELALGGVSTCVVDAGDVASGATAYSSRLIHGGLRYLEYGEFDLVRESLAERGRLARLAPHLVKPLRLHVPVANRWRGFSQAWARFRNRESKRPPSRPPVSRGLWLVRMGLWLYDRYAQDPLFPAAHAYRTGAGQGPPVSPARYPWTVSFFDAQVAFPERLTVALLHDARELARATGAQFSVQTHARVVRNGNDVEVQDRLRDNGLLARLRPDAMVNATGAWVDATLAQLDQPAPRLMRGTKGSHVVLTNERLRTALGDDGVYAEADDGRPVFLLPFGPWTLVGTTDEPFEGDPANAVASPAEIEYLLQTVHEILPGVAVSAADVMSHYAGVRPLPDVPAGSTAGITRRHWVEEHVGATPPLFSLIGGKLTTCRSLAEDAAARVRNRLNLPAGPNSRERALPGADVPADAAGLDRELADLATTTGHAVESLRAVWRLCGGLARDFAASPLGRERELLPDSTLPVGFVRWAIEREWARRTEDLVERRLMLLYDRSLSRRCLARVTQLLVEAGAVPAEEAESQATAAANRLLHHYGKRVLP